MSSWDHFHCVTMNCSSFFKVSLIKVPHICPHPSIPIVLFLKLTLLMSHPDLKSESIILSHSFICLLRLFVLHLPLSHYKCTENGESMKGHSTTTILIYLVQKMGSASQPYSTSWKTETQWIYPNSLLFPHHNRGFMNICCHKTQNIEAMNHRIFRLSETLLWA